MIGDSKATHFSRMYWARGILVEYRDGRSNGNIALQVHAWIAENGKGTPVLIARHGDLLWLYFSADYPDSPTTTILSHKWVSRVFSAPTLVGELSGVYAFAAINLSLRKAIVFTDRLGIQPIYYAFQNDVWRFSTHAMWLLLEDGHTGCVNTDGFLEHFGFGYTVTPYQELFVGIRKVAPASYLALSERGVENNSYWKLPLPEQELADSSVEKMATELQSGIQPFTSDRKAFLGITAGKDSLCLASIAPQGTIALTGSFGTPDCADRQQGRQISAQLEIPHVAETICPVDQFTEQASRIAFDSAGLTTASYVDMLYFVTKCVPGGSTFIMGEGGECVRDFFQVKGQDPITYLSLEYMTPVQYLRQTLTEDFQAKLNNYPENLLFKDFTEASLSNKDTFVLQFYREKRMPGNFSQRHQILSTQRPKVSPFLSSSFIDIAYRLKPAYYRGSHLHRTIIAKSKPELLPYFDFPYQAIQSTQEWPARFSAEVGSLTYDLLEANLSFSTELFNSEGVLRLCKNAKVQPSRAIYYLFRVLSFSLMQKQLKADKRNLLNRIRKCLLAIYVQKY